MGAWNSAAVPKRMSFEAADISLLFLLCSDCVLWVKWFAGGAQNLWVTGMRGRRRGFTSENFGMLGFRERRLLGIYIYIFFFFWPRMKKLYLFIDKVKENT